MKIRKLHIILLFSFLLICLSGCQPESGETIILLGEESDFTTPKQLMTMLTDAQQDAFFEALPGVVNVNAGLFPPDIMGEYKISLKLFVESNIGFDFFDDDDDVLLRVFDQQNRLAKVDFSEGGISRIDNAYVLEDGDRFMLYFTEEREVEFNGVSYRYERLIVITAKEVDEGLRDLYFGSIILQVENGIDPLVGNFEPGWYFIYKDADGLAERGDWF